MRIFVGRATLPGCRGRRFAVTRGVLVALATALAVGGSALVATPSAAGAATVVATEPQAQQRVDEAPGWVTLAFDSDIDSAVAKVIVQGPDGDNVTTGSLIVEGTNVTTQLREELPQGTYTVHYRVNSGSGDVEGGAFQFAYGTGSFGTLPDRKWSGSENEPAILRGTDPNATTEPPANEPTSTPPDVEVERSDGRTETADPGSPKTTKKASNTVEEPTGGETATDQPTEEPSATTPTATTESPSRLPLIVGGAVLVIAVGAGAVALGLRRGGGGGADGGGPGAGVSGGDGPGGSDGLTG